MYTECMLVFSLHNWLHTSDVCWILSAVFFSDFLVWWCFGPCIFDVQLQLLKLFNPNQSFSLRVTGSSSLAHVAASDLGLLTCSSIVMEMKLVQALCFCFWNLILSFFEALPCQVLWKIIAWRDVPNCFCGGWISCALPSLCLVPWVPC